VRSARTVLLGFAFIALAALFVSYGKLVRSVELAASAAGVTDGEAYS